MTVSFVVPIRRDRRLDRCIHLLHSFAKIHGFSEEIIVSGELLPGQCIKGARYIPIRPALKGSCVTAGVKCSTGEIVVVCDADFPISFNSLKELIESVNRHDISLSSRYLLTSSCSTPPPLLRQIASSAFRFVLRFLFNIRGVDTQCGVKAFRSDIASLIFNEIGTHGLAYDVDVILTATRLSANMCQLPVSWAYMRGTIRICRAAPLFFLEMIRLYALSKNRNKKPRPFRSSACLKDDITSHWSGRLRDLLERLQWLQ